MKVRFWGVRGSLATPVTSQQIQAKITAVIQRISAKDLESPDSRERFISKLPEWLFGTTGGNTPCIELKGNDGTEVILDAGTGIRSLGKSVGLPKNGHYNLFLSHLHWDHIQGFPFFDPAYNPETSIDIYSGYENTEQFLRNQQDNPYFPVDFEKLTKNIFFHCENVEKEFNIGCFKSSISKMTHPGDSYSISFTEEGKKFVYATDVELSQNDFESTVEHECVFRNADCIVLDSQYTVEESYKKANWGHSSFCYAVDFAVHWGIKKVFLFHHEPMYDDKKLNSILMAARWYAEYIVHSDVKVFLAVENQEFEI